MEKPIVIYTDHSINKTLCYNFAKGSNSLLCHKRNVSFYMPLADVPWDVTANNGRGKGNPTRSKLVNKTIEKIVQHEIKGNGAPARDARAFEFEEFKEVIRVARTKVLKRSKYMYKYMHTALLLTQYQLTARTDDVVLFDVAAGIAKGKALDIAQSSPVNDFNINLSKSLSTS